MLIVKFLGTILIVFSCSIIGFLKSYSLVLRCKKLSQLLDGVNALYENIDQGGNTLDVAIKNSFINCDFLLCEYGLFVCADASLKNDKILIEDFFNKLGSSTKKIECDRINNFKIKLKNQLKNAQSESDQKSKIYKTLGVCVGLAIAILLI